MIQTQLDWGHPILTPEGQEIRVPQSAFPQLRMRGLLERDRNAGLYRISEFIYELLKGDYVCLVGELRKMLGCYIEGPTTVACRCRPCRDKAQDIVHGSVAMKQLLDLRRPGLYEF